jgi:inorganic pyrophosphatase
VPKKSRSKKLPKANGSMSDPTRISRTDSEGQFRVVIETPRGSRNKYSYDSEQQVFVLKKVLPAGMTFPFDFGFVPATLAEDGDPIDVLLLMDEPAFPGCTVRARLVGALEAEEKNDKGEKQRNDRLIAVALESPTYSDMKSLDALGERLVGDIEKFFVTYQKLRGNQFKVIARSDAHKAAQLIEKSSRNYSNQKEAA